MTLPPFENDETPAADNVVRVDFSRPQSVASASAKQLPASASDLEKLKIFTELLDRGMAMVVLDARHEGVEVPAEFKSEPDLRLNFSRRFGIRDFSYQEQGLEATLSFAQGFWFCRIPWKAVFAIQSHVAKTGSIWPEDVPAELKLHIQEPAPTPAKVSKKPSLHLVKDT